MRITLDTRYRLRFPDTPKAVPEIRALNDLLGLHARTKGDLARYITWLTGRWDDTFVTAELAERYAKPLGICDVLHETVHRFVVTGSATAGRLSYTLDDTPRSFTPPRRPGKAAAAAFALGIAQPLELITYRTPGVAPPEGLRPGEIDVPALAELAVLALSRAPARDDVHPLLCDSCRRFYLGRAPRPAQPTLCDRLAPGAGHQTCQQRGAQTRFRRANLDYDRSRRAAFMKAQRGTITEKSYYYWRADNTPAAFRTYAEWVKTNTAKAREARRLDEELRVEREEARPDTAEKPRVKIEHLPTVTIEHLPTVTIEHVPPEADETPPPTETTTTKQGGG